MDCREIFDLVSTGRTAVSPCPHQHGSGERSALACRVSAVRSRSGSWLRRQVTASMSTTTVHHVPSLHLPEFDDDDAFDTADDEGAAYVFSPDAIREEMARNMPDDEPEPEPAPLSTHTNTSVSTLDIDAPPLSAMSDSLDSSFSQISLDTPARTHPDLPPLELEHSVYPSPPASTVADDPHDTNGVENNGYAYTGNSRSPTPPSSTPPSLPPPPHSAPAGDPSSSSRISPPHSASAPQNGFTSTTPRSSQDGGNVLLTEKTFPSRRARRSLGPSAFEKVVSKTRPTFLPPKPREEDKKHLADWQLMMAQSRQLGRSHNYHNFPCAHSFPAEKRRKALNERRLAREKTIEDTVHVWERDIMPDWRVVYRNAALRRLWWNGIPTKLRAQLWEKAVGNALALSKGTSNCCCLCPRTYTLFFISNLSAYSFCDPCVLIIHQCRRRPLSDLDHYRTCLSRAKRAISSGVFPQATMDLMEQDIATTLPSIHLFLKEFGPMYEDLKDILCAWVVSRSDEGLGYTLGAAKIAAMLLISMPGQRAFIVMRNLLERHCLRSFFGGERARDDVGIFIAGIRVRLLTLSIGGGILQVIRSHCCIACMLTCPQGYSTPCWLTGCPKVRHSIPLITVH